MSKQTDDRVVRALKEALGGEFPPPVEGDLSTRRHWIVLRTPGFVPEKKGPFRTITEVDAFVIELAEHRRETLDQSSVVSLTWDFDLWVQSVRERMEILGLDWEK